MHTTASFLNSGTDLFYPLQKNMHVIYCKVFQRLGTSHFTYKFRLILSLIYSYIHKFICLYI